MTDEVQYTDALMTMAADTMAELREENQRLRRALGAVAVDALQKDWENVLDWANSARVTFPNGEPEVSL